MARALRRCDGGAEGCPEGRLEGNPEGRAEGRAEGRCDGGAEGRAEGNPEAAVFDIRRLCMETVIYGHPRGYPQAVQAVQAVRAVHGDSDLRLSTRLSAGCAWR